MMNTYPTSYVPDSTVVEYAGRQDVHRPPYTKQQAKKDKDKRIPAQQQLFPLV